jgi:hypothetical protein
MKSFFQTILATLFIVAGCSTGWAQGWRYKPVPQQYLPKSTVAETPDYKNAFHLTSILPKNYDKQGRTDYTAIIQKALNEHSKVVFPEGIFSIAKEGLQLNSNQYLIFEQGSKLVMKPNALERYNILLLRDVNNITIFNAVLEGDRKAHLGKTGQWGAGIGIYGAQNVRIIGGKITDCWGDGICIARSKIANSENIKIDNVHIDNTRRNGISIVSVNGLTVNNLLASNVNGTDPQFGLDVEPDNGLDELRNIEINNLITFNCSVGGVLVAVGKFPSQKRNKQMEIVFNNPLDDGSKHGIWVGGITEQESNKLVKPVEGTVIVNKPIWKNNRIPYKIKVKSLLNPTVSISDPQIVTPLNKNYTVKELKKVNLGKARVKIE